MKLIEAQKAQSQPQAIQPKKIQQEGQGSVWNTNNYFWEEKSVAKWSEDTIKQCVSSFKHEFKGGELRITEVKKCTGESSVSIRKGKKLVTYDYAIDLKWECHLLEGEKSIANCKGEYVLPEVSQDEEFDWEVRATFTEDNDNLRKGWEQIVRKYAVEDLRKAIKTQFVDELKKK
mmetsp:Transcript_4843/g.3320  ORF Transcript_4843/g.3320 Transcript_4843/m.3320 type:complete len:175 (+) Transcript_4843:615-1139(+)